MSVKPPTFDKILEVFTQLKDNPIPKYVVIGYPYEGRQFCPYSSRVHKLLTTSKYASDHVFVILPDREHGQDFKDLFHYQNGTFPLVYKNGTYIGGSDELKEELQNYNVPSISDNLQKHYNLSDAAKFILVGYNICPFSDKALSHLKRRYPGQYQKITFDRSNAGKHRGNLEHKGTFPLVFEKKRKRVRLIGGADDFIAYDLGKNY